MLRIRGKIKWSNKSKEKQKSNKESKKYWKSKRSQKNRIDRSSCKRNYLENKKKKTKKDRQKSKKDRNILNKLSYKEKENRILKGNLIIKDLRILA